MSVNRLFVLIAALMLNLLTGCGGVQSVLNPAGPQAGRINGLWWLMLYVCTAVFVIVIITVFIAVYRSRKKEEKLEDAAHITPEPRSEQRMARVVTGAILATCVILFVFLIASFRTGRATYTLQDPSAVIIKVTGHQW